MIISPLVSIRAKQAREEHLRLQVKCTKVAEGRCMRDCKHFFVLSRWQDCLAARAVTAGKRVYECSYCLVVVAA